MSAYVINEIANYFKTNPKVSFPKVTVDVVDYILVTHLLHDDDFVDDEILLGLLLQIHLLDGNQLVALTVRRENTSGSTGSARESNGKKKRCYA